ncbi:guanine-1-methyltransferase-domain-containing protein [Kickxella alabastrina]|uniref:guanine-1-methyltransferase-domain-containing protein n=1 Tax=Kickxella alabastrina TaxID=61397 RepID=UPI00221F988F|nr:guanine-1-methyltransferase-domain-containing protein [Kickxella alabastrina]KAI7823967.1 guanine-1-methyltransferase-domain-containing protein [Kickxella alabastrina]
MMEPAEKPQDPPVSVTKTGPSVDTYQPQTITLAEFRSLTRNQQKKHMRHELWASQAEEYKSKQRQRNRECRKRRNQRLAQEAAETGITAHQRKKQRLQAQVRSGHCIVLDMDFEDKMEEKEIKSVCSQVMRCYGANRMASKRVDLHVTQLHGKIRERFETAMDQHVGWSEDHIVMRDAEYIDMYDKDKLVYFTADSPNVIDVLDPEKIYIIGGIVDKNRYPRLTLDKAEAQGIGHAQLPIGKYIKLSTRKVMTVNQIFEMIVRFVDHGSWKTAFQDVIPLRKFKEGDIEANDDENDDDDENNNEEEGDDDDAEKDQVVEPTQDIDGAGSDHK